MKTLSRLRSCKEVRNMPKCPADWLTFEEVRHFNTQSSNWSVAESICRNRCPDVDLIISKSTFFWKRATQTRKQNGVNVCGIKFVQKAQNCKIAPKLAFLRTIRWEHYNAANEKRLVCGQPASHGNWNIAVKMVNIITCSGLRQQATHCS